MSKAEGKVLPVIGLQWGDEGKGKIIDHLAADFSIVARPAGGPNTGHTVEVDGVTYKFHGLPEGALRPGTLNVIGPGAIIDPIKLNTEIESYRVADNDLIISHNTHLILPQHISLDEISEAGSGRQGTTKAGIRYAVGEKYSRTGVPLGQIKDRQQEIYQKILDGLADSEARRKELDLPQHQIVAKAQFWLDEALRLTKYAADTTLFLNEKLAAGINILASGAQSHWLDIDDQPYPYGSSTHTGVGGVITGLQVPPQAVEPAIGVMKIFKSRVGDGPFVTEITDQRLADKVRGEQGKSDSEFGTTSQRPRRVGYLDLPEVRRSILANGVKEIAVTKLDHAIRFGGSMLVATAYNEAIRVAPNQVSRLQAAIPLYEEVGLWSEQENEQVRTARSMEALPMAARKLIWFIEDQLDIKVKIIGTGADRRQIINRP